ncbi:MAG: orotate phosphoribosyltransferase [Chloroflexi bacterium]|nr:orotate phosphoribosyltransferase [Chloroflexota bacterium]
MASEIQIKVAKALLKIGAVGFSPHKPITFKSGLISPVYVDNRRLIFWPEQWHIIIQGFQQLVFEAGIQLEVIAGIETAGIPHSAALAFEMQMPSVFVRKQAKEHGTKSRIEGGGVEDKRVLLIEDLVTTGGSSLSGVEALRADEAIVTDCLAIVSYGFPQAATAFAAAGVTLHTLTNFSVICEQALEAGYFSADEMIIIQDWFSDAPNWAAKYGFAK